MATLSTVHHPSWHPDWIVPDWPLPPGVRALCTTRAGGVSLPPYDSFNLGHHVGDAPVSVARNRETLFQAIDHRPVFMDQVHGVGVLPLREGNQAAIGTPCADAAWTQERHTVCTVMVADCLPVLLCNKDGSWVAAAHAGWRGLAGVGHAGKVGILDRVLESYRAAARVNTDKCATDLIAWLGPCIGPLAFEVGDEVRAAFLTGSVVAEDQSALQACFTPQSGCKWLADLSGLARLRLAALGVTAVYGNDGSPPWCTVSQASRFFSHRRDRVSGRMAACIWRG